MSKLKWILTAIGVFLAILFGRETMNQRELKKLREQALEAERKALAARNAAAMVKARAEISRIDEQLRVARTGGIRARVRVNADESRSRQGL